MYPTTFTFVFAAAMLSQVFSARVLLVVFDNINDEFIDDKMPLLKQGADIGQHAARPSLLKSENLTKSFPNLHTLATGVLPNEHGVIANKMFDKNGQVAFHTSKQFNYDPVLVPIWVDAAKTNIKTATYMWPGTTFFELSENLIITKEYVQEKGELWDSRITEIKAWFTNDGIQFGMAYFEDIDTTESVDSYIGRVQDAIKELYNGLKDLGVDIIIMSNHGFKEIQKKNVLKMDKYVSKEKCNCEFIVSGAVSFLRFNNSSDLDATYKTLSKHLDNGNIYKVYKRDGWVMDGWNLKDLDLLENILFVATYDKYTFYDDDKYETLQNSSVNIVREDGYHKNDIDMNTILFLTGPSFKENVVTENEIALTEVYQLIKRLLRIDKKASNKQRLLSASVNMEKLIKHNVLKEWKTINYIADI